MITIHLVNKEIHTLKRDNFSISLFIEGIVNDMTNFCFLLLQEPYMEAPARPKTKFPMSLTISL